MGRIASGSHDVTLAAAGEIGRGSRGTDRGWVAGRVADGVGGPRGPDHRGLKGDLGERS